MRNPFFDVHRATAAYAIVVRSSEYELSPEMLDDLVARTVSSSQGGGSRQKGRDDDEDMDEYR